MTEKYAGLSLGVDVSQVNNAVKSLKDFKQANDSAKKSVEDFVDQEVVARQRAKDLAQELSKQRKEFQSIQSAIDPTAAKMEKLRVAADKLDKLWKSGVVPDKDFFRLGEVLESQQSKLERSRKALTEEGRAALEESKAKAKAAAEAQKFIAALKEQEMTAGKTRAELMEMKAAQLGVSNEAAPFIARLREQDQQVQKLGMSVGQYRQAMRMLPAQITDVTTSLASGMPVWLVAIQQGGQIKDSFGGIIPTMKALVSLINPFKVGLAGVLGTMGYMVYSAYSANKELKAISETIKEATGLSSDFSDKLAVSVQQLADVSGKTAEDLVKSFGTTKDSAGSLIKKMVDLGMSYHDAAQLANEYKQSGDITALNGKISEHMAKVAELEKTWWDVAKARLKAMGSVLTGDPQGEYAGKKDTRRKSNLEGALEIMTEYGKKNKEIADANSKALAEATAEVEKQYFNTNRVASAQKELNDLLQKQKLLERSNNEEAKQQTKYLIDAKKKEIEDLKKLEEKKGKGGKTGGGVAGSVVDQLDKELYVLQAQLRTLKEHRTVNDVISSQRKALWSIEKQIEILEEAQSKRALTAGEKNLLAEQKSVIAMAQQKAELGDQIKLEERKIKLEQQSTKFIYDQIRAIDELRGKAAGKSDVQIKMESEIQKLRDSWKAQGGGMEDQALQGMIAKVKERYAEEEALRNNWKAGAKQAWNEYAQDATDVYSSVQEIASSALNGLADQMTEFLTTGKANFKDFSGSIIKMITQMIMKMVIFNSMAGMFGGQTWTMGSLMKGFATGGYTGDGGKYDPAGVVHKGEFVFTKEATQRIGAKNLYRLMRGYANGGSVGGSGYSRGSSTVQSGAPLSFGDINVDINNGNDPKGLESGVRMLVHEIMQRECGQGGIIFNFVHDNRR